MKDSQPTPSSQHSEVIDLLQNRTSSSEIWNKSVGMKQNFEILMYFCSSSAAVKNFCHFVRLILGFVVLTVPTVADVAD